jgi:four helix bundle protein
MQPEENVWNTVIARDTFAKYSIGLQYIKAADLVAANIREEFGRFYFNDSGNFLCYSRRSLFEKNTWTAHNRQFISEDKYIGLITVLLDLNIKLNNYINTKGKTSGTNQ